VAHLADRSAHTLSGGEAQRVSLARAFAVEPEILFLDEPLSALDAPTRESILQDLAENLRQTRLTTVFSTHDRLEALLLADRMLVLRDGAVAQVGTPADLFQRPVDAFVAQFLGMETLLEGHVVRAGGGDCHVLVHDRLIETVGDAQAGESVLLGVRPENVILVQLPFAEGTSARNRFEGRVQQIAHHGPVQRVLVDCGFPLTAFVTRASAEELGLAPGAAIGATFKATGTHLLRRRPHPAD
jgi:tungstate transport system ATP-binding protein